MEHGKAVYSSVEINSSLQPPPAENGFFRTEPRLDDMRMDLLVRVSKAAHEYADIAGKLASSASIHSPKFKELLQQTELARAKIRKARAEFEQYREY